MDSQRPFLYLTLLFMLFLVWTTWQQDHAPKPATPTTSSVSTPASNGGSATQEVPAQVVQLYPVKRLMCPLPKTVLQGKR